MQVSVGQDPLVGQLLENLYRVEELMAQGGMGSIYRATQMRLNFPVAVKVLRPDLVSDEKIVKRFIREALAVSQLRHPHVVRLYDAGRTPQGIHFIVMEFLPGLSLDRRIARDTRMDPHIAMSVISQSAAALAMAHRKGIIHRDLKPANIFLEEAEGVDVFAKVLDFGIAKFHPNTGEDMTKLTVAGSTMGTPHYMSPEQIQGHEVNRWADIYSLGVILWECVVGAPPFKGDSPMEVFMGHIEDPLPPLKKAAPGLSLPDGLEAVIKKALAKRPVDRFQNMEELKDAIEQINRGHKPSLQSGTSSGFSALPSGDVLSVGSNNGKFYIAMGAMSVIIIVLGVLLALLAGKSETPEKSEPRAKAPTTSPSEPVATPDTTTPTPPTVKPTHVRFFSVPSRATVHIGGEVIGETPLSHEIDADIASLEVTFTLDAHKESKVTLKPTKGSVAGRLVVMIPENVTAPPEPGDTEIFVFSKPDGAAVVIGDKMLFPETPDGSTIPRKEGQTSVTITVRKEGYLDEHIEIPFIKDQQIKIEGLELIATEE